MRVSLFGLIHTGGTASHSSEYENRFENEHLGRVLRSRHFSGEHANQKS